MRWHLGRSKALQGNILLCYAIFYQVNTLLIVACTQNPLHVYHPNVYLLLGFLWAFHKRIDCGFMKRFQNISKLWGSSISCSLLAAVNLNKASGLKCGKKYSHFSTVMLLTHIVLVNHHYWDQTPFLHSAFLELSLIYVCNQLFIRPPFTLASCCLSGNTG